MDDFANSRAEAAATRVSTSSSLLGKTTAFVAFSLAFTVLGCFVATTSRIPQSTIWLPGLAGLACILLLAFLREVPVVNLGLMYGMAFSMGMTIGPALDAYVRAGYSDLVYEAAGLTAALTFALSAYALTTGRDFSRLEDYLYFALLGLILVGVASLFLQVPYLHLGIGLVGAAVFCGFILVDVRKARDVEDTMGNAVLLAVNIYLDILNLFLYLLQLLLEIAGSGDD